jgi:hypothetical protein
MVLPCSSLQISFIAINPLLIFTTETFPFGRSKARGYSNGSSWCLSPKSAKRVTRRSSLLNPSLPGKPFSRSKILPITSNYCDNGNCLMGVLQPLGLFHFSVS